MVFLDAHHIIFDVMAKESARVRLSLAPGVEDSQGYEVRLAEGTSEYGIYQNGEAKDIVDKSGLVSDTRYTRFWLSWSDKVSSMHFY